DQPERFWQLGSGCKNKSAGRSARSRPFRFWSTLALNSDSSTFVYRPEIGKARGSRLGRFAQNETEGGRDCRLHQFGDKSLEDALIQMHILANDGSFAEYGFTGFVGGLLAPIEKADGNAVAPLLRALCGLSHVCRIIPFFVLELVNALLEILVGVQLVVGNAGTEHVNQRKTLVLDARGNQIGHMIWFP